jgi:7-cyano-7-deazaguanine reductase
MPTLSTDLQALTKLGKPSKPERTLEVFPNKAPANQMEVTIECTEFTCFCPLTKQPDFAKVFITYMPDEFIVESKSLKLYLESFREEGVFHEHLAVDIGRDFESMVKPLWVEVAVDFNIRGGIGICARYRSPHALYVKS